MSTTQLMPALGLSPDREKLSHVLERITVKTLAMAWRRGLNVEVARGSQYRRAFGATSLAGLAAFG
jgi:hypothetical protein